MLLLSAVEGLETGPVGEGRAGGQVRDGLKELQLAGHGDVELLRLLILRDVVVLLETLPASVDETQVLGRAEVVFMWLEHLPSKQCVVGSNPTRAALFSFQRKKSCLG